MMKKGDLRDFKHGTVYRELLEKEKICSERQFSWVKITVDVGGQRSGVNGQSALSR